MQRAIREQEPAFVFVFGGLGRGLVPKAMMIGDRYLGLHPTMDISR